MKEEKKKMDNANKAKVKKEKTKSKENKNGIVIKTVKILTIILLIILVSMIGFFGIYKQDKNQMSNVVKDYSYSMDIDGARTIKMVAEEIEISDDTDEEEKEEEETETSGEEASEDTSTEEIYKNAKKVLEKRLKALGVEEYSISLNTTTGDIVVKIPENSYTDMVVSNLYTVGKFEIIDSETEEVLLDNDDIKSSDVLYYTSTSGTTIYLEIEFTKEGKAKLEEISNTYATIEEDEEDTTSEDSTETDSTEETDETTDTETAEETTDEETEEEEEETQKEITMKIDDEEIMTTSFDEPITTGEIQLSVGSATTDTDTLQDYIDQAQSIAIVLDSGNLPVEYNIEKNQYILSTISEQDLIYVAIIVVIGIIILIIKYKMNGLLAGFSYIGLVALYLLLVRYTNVVISIESIFGIIIMLLLNYIFTVMLLKNIKEISKEKKEHIVNKATLETYKKFFIRIIPICILVIAFCFVNWIPVSSFGMISFWGLVIIAVYNAIITRYLLKIKVEDK